ncbi:MAG: adenine phosphoribosyltransferase [Candidatus Omnitrophica bacterium]|nr:Adenine phosphoribosyltransferase [bacterium]NUN96024.1 adenine phosphoribosyltransferase [Candidatus Omnitrophota bacterium]
MNHLRDAIRGVPDFPKPGILFRDITTLLKDGRLFQQAVDLFAERYAPRKVSAIAGIESRGFLIGSALAYKLGCGIVLIRKAGKLPAPTYTETYALEYGEDRIQIHRDALSEGDRVVLIDDLLATGGTMRAAVNLLKHFEGVEILEAGFLIELADLGGRKQLADVEVFSAITF